MRSCFIAGLFYEIFVDFAFVTHPNVFSVRLFSDIASDQWEALLDKYFGASVDFKRPFCSSDDT